LESLITQIDDTISKFYQKCRRAMQAYKDGMIHGTPQYAERVYKSHRRVAN